MRLTYYPDITQGQPAERVRHEVEVFAGALAEQLSADLGTSLDIEVPPVLDVPAQFDDIVGERSAIALMKPVTYVFAHRRDERIVPACVAHRPIDGQVGTTYYGQVYTRRDTGITSLDQLDASRAGTLAMAYGDRFSTSNFLIPANILRREAGIHPFLYFARTEFTGGHDLAAEAVYDGRADIGAGHDGVITILAETRPDAPDKLVRLGREDIHSDPVVVHTGLLSPPVTLESIQDACVKIAKAPDVQAALDLFWGWVKDLSPTEHGNYASIEAALAGLHLDEADMLR
jgi:ABC-type phosphate/phosphonate transport system substrate-binding protein